MIQLGIATIARQQCGMCPLLNDAPLVDNDNQIGVAHSAGLMSCCIRAAMIGRP